MCAILGRLFINDHHTGRSLESALDILGRRGPDGYGVWRSQNGKVELAHTRLAIVDLNERATQPMVDVTNHFFLAFNGEIYNFRELRQNLTEYSFRTESDSEVILALYATHGINGFSLLKGMYSFCLVDIVSEKVWLVRDPVGKKPLFIAHWNSQILFGSTLQALSLVAGGDRRIDNAAADGYWADGFISPTASVWHQARPLLPGEILEVDWSGKEISRRFHYCKPAQLFSGECLTDVVLTIDTLLESAVSKRLNAIPNPTVLCSGGIDSTVVSAMAYRLEKKGLLENPIRLVTLGSVIPYTNDECYARYVGYRFSRKTDVIRPNAMSLPDDVFECLGCQDEPLAMISFFPLWRLVKCAPRISPVLLSGDGGDEFFLGYDQSKRWHQGKQPGNILVGSEQRQLVPCGPPLPPWMSEWGRSIASHHLVGHSFTKIDRASAEQGVEIRCPLLDWDLVSYARSLPYELLTIDPVLKPLLKRLLHEWPRPFVNRSRLGFSMNMRYLWLATNFKGLREMIVAESQTRFDRDLPAELRKNKLNWSRSDIFRNFPQVWKLAAWSQFLIRNQSLPINAEHKS
jgi:asparagine synthase (glutamine-hydrolysing)